MKHAMSILSSITFKSRSGLFLRDVKRPHELAINQQKTCSCLSIAGNASSDCHLLLLYVENTSLMETCLRAL